MVVKRSRPGLSLQLSLLLLLLTAQSFAFAHELDNSGEYDSNLCAVCSIGHGLDAPIISSYEPPVAIIEVHPLNANHLLARLSTIELNHAARAPPFFL